MPGCLKIHMPEALLLHLYLQLQPGHYLPLPHQSEAVRFHLLWYPLPVPVLFRIQTRMFPGFPYHNHEPQTAGSHHFPDEQLPDKQTPAAEALPWRMHRWFPSSGRLKLHFHLPSVHRIHFHPAFLQKQSVCE